MENNTVETEMVRSEIGYKDRSNYWRKQINGKTVAEIADIISDFENRATRDKLTGLINKDEFEIEFKALSEGAFRRGSSVFIFFFDFDDLKRINDTEGHKAGNALLTKGTMLLQSSLRPADLLSRIGGDEFAAAIEIDSAKGNKDVYCENIAGRLISKLAEGNVSISIGIKEFNKGDDLEDILDKADRNMTLDKVDRKAGRDYLKANV